MAHIRDIVIAFFTAAIVFIVLAFGSIMSFLWAVVSATITALAALAGILLLAKIISDDEDDP